MGGGGGGSSTNTTINQKNISNIGGSIGLEGMFAFNYKGGNADYRKNIESTARGEFTSSADSRSQGGKGGDSSVGLGLSYGGMDPMGGGGLGGLGGFGGSGSGSGGAGGGGFGSASNSGYSPTEMNGGGSPLTINKGIDSKFVIVGGCAVALAYILAQRKGK